MGITRSADLSRKPCRSVWYRKCESRTAEGALAWRKISAGTVRRRRCNLRLMGFEVMPQQAENIGIRESGFLLFLCLCIYKGTKTKGIRFRGFLCFLLVEA